MYSQTIIKQLPMGILIQVDHLTQVPQIRGIIKNNKQNHFMS